MKNDMNVLFIMPPSPNVNMTIGFDVHTMPPLGIGYIATYLENSGYSCKIIDMNIPEITIYDVINELRKRKYRLVGISTTTECYNTSVRIANIIKCEDVDYIMMGGAHATFEYETILQNNIIDFVVRSEGEITTKKLCDYIYLGKGDLANIDGLSYRKGTDIVTNKNVEFICDLDELPFPNRKLYDLEKYPHKGNISTSRGCPGKCIFCAASALAGGKYRMRSAASIMEEVLYLYGLGIRHIDFVDDTMTASVKRLNEFLNLLLKHQLPITWYCESRVDSMNYELLKKMKKAGLTSIQFGVESGNQEMLDCLKKNISLGQVEDVFRWCYELDITVTTNMIIGQPYDTEESIDDTMKLAKKLIECNAHVSYTICTPYPGTYLWNNSKELGIEIVETDYDKYSTFYPVINTKNFTARQLRNLYYKAVMEVARNSMRKNQDTRTGSSIRRDESIILANEKAQVRLSKYKIGGSNYE